MRSYTGMSYLFVTYCYVVNAILVKPRKNLSDDELFWAFTKQFIYLTSKGFYLAYWIMQHLRPSENPSKAKNCLTIGTILATLHQCSRTYYPHLQGSLYSSSQQYRSCISDSIIGQNNPTNTKYLEHAACIKNKQQPVNITGITEKLWFQQNALLLNGNKGNSL